MIVLAVDVEKQLGAFKVNVRFEAAGGATALFGPSGCGQDLARQHDRRACSSRIAALSRSTIRCCSTPTADIDVPPHRRRIGYVFQEGRLFPHLSVRQNLDYGRRMSRQPRDHNEFERIAALLDIGQLLDRRPSMLSGGERQRVAVGRALLMQSAAVVAR